MTVDHFIPEALGGSSEAHNLLPCCDRCNSSKKSRDPVTWMRQVGVPESRIAVLLQVTSDPGWRRPPNLTIARTQLTYLTKRRR